MKRLGLIAILAWVCCGAEKGGLTTVEAKAAKITIGTRKVGNYETGVMPSMIVFYAKVENQAATALDVDPTKFYLKTDAGKALRCMSAAEATESVLGATAKMRSVVGMGIAGGANGRQIISAQEQQAGATIRQRMLAPGPVPPSSFREGVVYCEGTGEKKPEPLQLHLVGLHDAPVPLAW